MAETVSVHADRGMRDIDAGAGRCHGGMDIDAGAGGPHAFALVPRAGQGSSRCVLPVPFDPQRWQCGSSAPPAAALALIPAPVRALWLYIKQRRSKQGPGVAQVRVPSRARA